MRIVAQFADYLRSCYAPMPVPLLDAACLTRDERLGDAAAAVVLGSGRAQLLLRGRGLGVSFVGYAPNGGHVTILERGQVTHPCVAPPSFRVAAIVPAFNEADVIAGTLQYLVNEGIGVYVIDNWSTDQTPAIVRQFTGRGLLGMERFPADHAPGQYDLRGILARVEEVASGLDADWLILHDADERRRTPWPGVGLRDGLYHVERSGFTCIDHVTLNFWATDDSYDATRDLEAHFSHFEFSDHPGHFHQRRAWKNLGQRVSLAPTAGHDVGFHGRRVYPFKFLLKHYPIRSAAHGRRKVLQERRARWNPAERTLGWHQQYEQVQAFIRTSAELEQFDPQTFYERRLLERLSGVGIFAEPPDWATPPMWHPPPAA
ncbi:MAG: glycosyltransferase [Chloroflexota bacterium]